MKKDRRPENPLYLAVGAALYAGAVAYTVVVVPAGALWTAIRLRFFP